MKHTMILTRQRSDEEKRRRHLYGDSGAKFSAGKVPKIDGGGDHRVHNHMRDKGSVNN